MSRRPALLLPVALLQALGLSLSAGVNNWTNRGPEGGGVESVCFDPHDPSICYAVASGRPYKSTDQGRTWGPLPFDGDIRNSSIVSDPVWPHHLYLVGSRILESNDGGASWEPLATFQDTVRELVIEPGAGGAFYARTAASVFASFDHGRTWRMILSETYIDDIALTSEPDSSLLVGTSSGLYRSADQGAHWVKISSEPVIVVVAHPEKPETILISTPGNILRTTDGGQSWDVKLSTPEGIEKMVFSSRDPTKVYAAILRQAGVHRSTDEGETWSESTSSLPGLSVYSIASDTSNPALLLAGTIASGVFRSEDGGATWTASSMGIRQAVIEDVEIDPVSKIVYAVNWARGVFRSANFGRSWLPGTMDQARTYAGLDLEIDKHNPSVLYVLLGGRLYRSADAGQNWSQSSFPYEAIYIKSDPRVAGRVFAFTSQHFFASLDYGDTWTTDTMRLPSLIGPPLIRADEDRIYVPTNAGLYVSKDTVSSRLLSPYLMTELAADPSAPGHLYGIRLSGGVFKSTDRGESWTVLGLQNEDLSRLAIDPNSPRVVIAFGLSGLWRSLDSGKNWKRLARGGRAAVTYNRVTAFAADLSGPNPRFFAAFSNDPGLQHLEYHSSFFIPRLRSVAGEQETGVALANRGAEPANLTLTALDSLGLPLQGPGIRNPSVLTLNPGEQKALTARELFAKEGESPELTGWIRVDGAGDAVTGFFSAFSANLEIFDTGEASGKTASTLVFDDLGSSNETAEIWLANPGGDEAAIMIELRDADGRLAAEQVNERIPPGGLFRRTVKEMFGTTTASAKSYVRVVADQPLTGLDFLAASGRRGAIVGPKDAGEGASLLYSPQFAASPEVTTVVNLVNLDTKPGAIRVRLLGNNGAVLAPEREISIGPLGKVVIGSSDFFPAETGAGYLEIRSPWVSVTGSARFGDPEGDRYSASLPLVTQGARELVFSHLVSTSQYFTGLAIVNGGPSTALVTIEVQGADGSVLAVHDEEIEPGQRRSRLLTEYCPQLAGQTLTAGLIRVVSDQPIVAFALFGPNDLSSIAAIPAQVIR